MPRRKATRWRRCSRSPRRLKDPNASLAEKQLALRFVVHLVGDLHQPLHAGTCCDRGGNDVKVKWFGKDTNLHAVWDTSLVEEEQLSFTELAAKLERHISNRDLIGWWDINPRDWATESAQLRETVYPPPAKGKVRSPLELSYSYVYEYTPLMERRLKRGGRSPCRLPQRHLRRAAAATAGGRTLMMRKFGVLAGVVALAGCATPQTHAPVASAPIEVQILAINDFHGNIETPPEAVSITRPDGTVLNARVGGAAQLAAALEHARHDHPNSITVAAGDLIGASPLVSADSPRRADDRLDEPAGSERRLGRQPRVRQGHRRVAAHAAGRLRRNHEPRAVRGSSCSAARAFSIWRRTSWAMTE